MRKVTITFLTDWEDKEDVKETLHNLVNGTVIQELLPESEELDPRVNGLRSVDIQIG